MERLPAHPRRLPALTFLGGALVALMLLGAGGGSPLDALRLLAGVLPVGDHGEGLLRALLGRMSRTFLLVSLALVTGMSLALATTMLLARWWRPLRVVAGWSSRLIGAVPPMAWALGLLFLFIQVWQLPVESLFPSRPAAQFDSWLMKTGRRLWYLAAPALALALPVYALTLRACLLRLDRLWREPLTQGLRARGCSREWILWHHLTPRLWPHLMRLSWPVTTLMLAFAIVVEEVFMLEGWGRFMADALREHNTLALAAGCYGAGMLLALWFLLFAFLENPLATAGRLMPLRLPFHRAAWMAAGVLLLLLVSTRWWNLPFSWWRPSLSPMAGEVSTALALAGTAVGMVTLGLFSRWLLLAWLAVALLLPLKAALFLLLATALGIPEWLQARAELRRVRGADFLVAARMLGSAAGPSLWRHASRCLWPLLAAGFFRMASAALVWISVLTFFGYGAAEGLPAVSWGGLMHAGSVSLLDNPLPALVPAMWVAFWCLCFQWFARGFGVGGPSFSPANPPR